MPNPGESGYSGPKGNKPLDITPKVKPMNPKEWGWRGTPYTLTSRPKSSEAIY